MTESAIDPRPIPDLLPVREASLKVTTLRETRPAATASHARPSHRLRSRSRVQLLFALAGVIYLADLVTKVVAVAWLTEDAPVAIGGTGVSLRLIRNPGAAFGLGVDVTALFTAITVLVVVAILRAVRRLGSMPWALTLGLLLGGALGNLTDRLARSPGVLHGHVIDFVEIPGWPIFNVADLSICLAGVLMVALACRNVPIDGGPRRT